MNLNRGVNMKNIYNIIFCILFSLGLTIATCASAQNTTDKESIFLKNKKAWEFGIGGTGFHMTRFSVIDFKKNDKNGYFIETSKKDALFGGNIYLARELNPYFYLDMQGSVGYASDPVRNGHDSRWLGLVGLGLQWRLGEYFNSKYIEPFFRVGANYMYKNFNIDYNGIESLDIDKMEWNFTNDYNKDGKDRKNLIPIALGTGVNMWLNDRLGIALQADYLVMPYKDIANSWQGTVRLMWRFGGKSKKALPEIQYVDKIVERIVEKPVEKIVEVPVEKESICELFNSISFDFDKASLTAESYAVIDEIANAMKNNRQNYYLIIGSTDIKGSSAYNIGLSKRRAKTVVDALIDRGVPRTILKSRGIGKKISYAAEEASDQIRRGDRKVFVEIITNKAYWDYIK